ncbi:hypothetical protein SAMN02745179_00422 [Mycoplasmopsis agassizii]|nr:hypothetical protein SAMN02745179_00422 [Mycoplasmopsis agassizii]
MFAGSLSAIACSAKLEHPVEITPEDIRLKLTGQGTDISEKVLENKKTVLQLKTVGYNQFTFSDYWWSFSDNNLINNASRIHGIDSEKSISYSNLEKANIEFLPVEEVFFKVDGLKNLEKEINETSMLKTAKSLSDQKTTDKQFKSISLVTDEESLKTQLRISEEEKERFSKFIKEKVDSNLTEEQIEKLKPWNSYFSYNLINEKLDFEKNNYLFVKDLTEFIEDSSYYLSEKYKEYVKVDKGVQLSDYDVNAETKTITLKFSLVEIPLVGQLLVPTSANPYIYTGPKDTTSWFLPIEKSILSDFDLNEWKIERNFHFPVND